MLILCALASTLASTPWPLPLNLTLMGDATSVASILPSFIFTCLVGTGCATATCKTHTIVTSAFARFEQRLRPPSSSPPLPPAAASAGVLTSVSVCFASSDDTLGPNTDESYSLVAPNDGVGSLNATTMFGALRGLETLAQLLDLYGVATTARQISHAPIHVSDAPRFSYRGLLIDSGRHFLPVASIKAVIDAMAYNKLNVLHWHIVDASAFPCGSVAFPELAAEGAYDPSAIYSVADLADVVAYAKARAVRVLPEWDVPGHGRWGAVPGIMGCSDVLDPTADKTYEFLATFLGEMAGIFTEQWMFLGGDEVDSTCWDQNPTIAAWLRDHAMNSSQLQQYFWRQLEARVLPGLNKTIGVWEADGLQISLDSLAQGMFVNVYQGLETSNKTVWANKMTVLSIAGDWWYLDQLGCGGYHQSGWTCTYDVLAPPSFNYGPEQLTLMKGGETAMWGEGINKDNAAQYIWRGAAAAAERLWSAQARTPSHSQATERFQEHLCRLAMLGVRAGPIGPNFCPADAQAPMAAAALTALNALASSSETETVALSRAQFEAVRSALQLAAASGF